MLGVLPTGEILYYRYKTLFLASPAGTGSAQAKAIDFGSIADLQGYGVGFKMSPSGRYVAAVKRLLSRQDTANHIWLKDLETGRERILLSLPADQIQGPFLGLVGWIEQ